MHDVAVRFGKCCSPVPGDEILGYITRGRGVTIHRTDCVNVIHMDEVDRSRLIDADWENAQGDNVGERYMVEIIVYANNRNGLLADISRTLTEKGIDIVTLNTRTSKQGIVTLISSFEVTSKMELQNLMDRLRSIDSVLEIERTAG